MNAVSKDIYMYALGIIILFSLIFVVILMIFHAVPTENKDMLNIVLGALVMMASAVVNYFFGSSKGSADKTLLMHKDMGSAENATN